MSRTYSSCEVLKGMGIDWLGLPRLTSLRTIGSDLWTSYAFANPHHIILESDSHPLWMMFRHSQSHRCEPPKGLLLQGWRHDEKHPLHPSLTNRHLSSTPKLLCPEWLLLCYPICCWFWPYQPTEFTQASFVAPRMAWKETNNENRHFKSSESNQNRRNNVNSGKSP